MKDGTFQPNNQRLDFLNRDRLMYDISFYEFVSDYEKTKIPPNFEKRDGDFRFTSRHPQHNTHYLRRRKHSAVPVIVGLPFPDKEKKPELWHYLFLLLFKPFFTLDEMSLNVGETYVEKFNNWDINSLPDAKQARILALIENIKFMTTGMEIKKIEEQARADLRASQQLDPKVPKNAQEEEHCPLRPDADLLPEDFNIG